MQVLERPHRRQRHRQARVPAGDAARAVDLAHVVQDARPEGDGVEPEPVAQQGRLGLGPAGQVVPHPVGDVAPRGGGDFVQSLEPGQAPLPAMPPCPPAPSTPPPGGCPGGGRVGQGNRTWNFGGPCDGRRPDSSPLQEGREGGPAPACGRARRLEGRRFRHRAPLGRWADGAGSTPHPAPPWAIAVESPSSLLPPGRGEVGRGGDPAPQPGRGSSRSRSSVKKHLAWERRRPAGLAGRRPASYVRASRDTGGTPALPGRDPPPDLPPEGGEERRRRPRAPARR